MSAVLEAAERHLLERGYEDAKVDAIAADADVAVGSIYNYFGSKEGLYAALLERALERFELYMSEDREPELSAFEQVLDIAGRLARFGREYPAQLRLLSRVQPETTNEELSHAQARVAKTMADHERRTAALIEASVRRGAATEINARDAAAFLWSAWMGMLTLSRQAQRAAPGRDRELRAVIEAALRIVVGGLASDSARETDETVRAILESAPRRPTAPPQKRPLELHRRAVTDELRSQFPELGLWTAEVDAGASASPASVKRRLETSGERFTATAAIGTRGESTPWAYRVFVRRLGVDPDEPQRPVEAVALQRARVESFESRGLPDDALLIAAAETGVPVLAFDAAHLEGELWLRGARRGERLGGSGEPISEGRAVLADSLRPVAVPFGPSDPDAAITGDTRRVVLAGLQVKGVPDINVEEALWTVVEIIRSAAR